MKIGCLILALSLSGIAQADQITPAKLLAFYEILADMSGDCAAALKIAGEDITGDCAEFANFAKQNIERSKEIEIWVNNPENLSTLSDEQEQVLSETFERLEGNMAYVNLRMPNWTALAN